MKRSERNGLENEEIESTRKKLAWPVTSPPTTIRSLNRLSLVVKESSPYMFFARHF